MIFGSFKNETIYNVKHIVTTSHSMEFNTLQQLAIQKTLQGENVFITGPGGTGKTAVIKEIQRQAILQGKNVQVCALTGCAAFLLVCGAKTLHSWANIGLCCGDNQEIIAKVVSSQQKADNWRQVHFLIVDEVSMMSKKIFDVLNQIGQGVKRNTRPFGGIQLLFSGDFYQLPPVGNRADPDSVKFCFQSTDWKRAFPNMIEFTEIFRQKDPIYSKLLNQVRIGRLSKSNNERLMDRVGMSAPEDAVIKPAKIFPTKDKVNYVNQLEMSRLDTEERTFTLSKVNHVDMAAMSAKDRRLKGCYSEAAIEYELAHIQNSINCDETFKCKIGAQVMCIVNKETASGEKLCNGSQGIVVQFNGAGYPIVLFKNGVETVMEQHLWKSEKIPGVGIQQVPLILAWALTVHKIQGATLDCAEVDAGTGIFECGQTYVSLSRVKSLEGLYLTSYDPRRIKINKDVQDFYQELQGTDVVASIAVEA